MITSLIDQLKRDEGLRLKAYQDSGGVWTVGYGHTGMDVTPHMNISEDRANDLLYEDIDIAAKSVNRELPDMRWALDEARYGVMVNMAFNLGVNGLMKFHQFIEAMGDRNYPDAARYMMESLWAEQVGERAIRLRDQVLTGEWQ